jgi:hypothetical protein
LRESQSFIFVQCFQLSSAGTTNSAPRRASTDQRAGILAAIEHGLSNARAEAINTQIRLITRRAFGFHSAQALIALAMLTLADLCPPLPR